MFELKGGDRTGEVVIIVGGGGDGIGEVVNTQLTEGERTE